MHLSIGGIESSGVVDLYHIHKCSFKVLVLYFTFVEFLRLTVIELVDSSGCIPSFNK